MTAKSLTRTVIETSTDDKDSSQVIGTNFDDRPHGDRRAFITEKSKKIFNGWSFIFTNHIEIHRK